MINIIKKPIIKRAWDKKTRTVNTILSLNTVNQTLLITPKNTKERAEITVSYDRCIIEGPSKKVDKNKELLYENDVVNYAGYNKPFIVKMGKHEEFTLHNIEVDLPLVEIDSELLEIVGHAD